MKCFRKKKSRKSRAGDGAEDPFVKGKTEILASTTVPATGRTCADQKDGHFFSKTVPISDSVKSPSSCYGCNNSDEEQPADLENQKPPSVYTQYSTDLPGIAYMSVSKDDPFYNMNHPRRGKAVIFNFDHWDNTMIPDLGLSPRLGSEKDRDDLTKSLRRLDFEVKAHNNCGNLPFWDILKKLAEEDHSSCDCLVVVIMTHGERNTIYMRDGTQIPVNLIWENFEADMCPTLAGKPKIFIVQACRGKKYDNGTVMTNSRSLAPQQASDVTDSGTFSYVIPNAADIIVAFSCPLGHYSWRNPEKGSWFIQAICKVFDQYAYTLDLQGLFTTVAREVALNYKSNTTEWESDQKKQVTSTSSTLIRTVCFKPKFQQNPFHVTRTAEISINTNGHVTTYIDGDIPEEAELTVSSL